MTILYKLSQMMTNLGREGRDEKINYSEVSFIYYVLLLLYPSWRNTERGCTKQHTDPWTSSSSRAKSRIHLYNQELFHIGMAE